MHVPQMKRYYQTASMIALGGVIACWSWGLAPVAFAADGPTPENSGVTGTGETVMVVGGSVAHGWADPAHDSYLRRGFATIGGITHVNYHYADQSIPGSPAVAVSSMTFASWLNTDKPDIVVISWGILDDIHANTSIPDFQRTIRDEIAQSLNARAVVLVVTPPVVPANATQWHQQFETYVSAERQVTDSFSSSNVHWFDVNSDMASLLIKNDLPVRNYSVRGWHPNASGQQLAGQLFANQLMKYAGQTPIEFRTARGASR